MTLEITKAPNQPATDRSIERLWHARGHKLVAGIDEVGRGPLAGPVVAAAVILPEDDRLWFFDLRDSKILTLLQRETLAERLRDEAMAFGVGVVPSRRIDEIGIAPAAREAMRLAVLQLSPRPQALLLDAFALPEVDLPQQPVVRGDATCCAIAAASIIAKVARDRIMVGLERRHPGYGFSHNRGYATAEHREALQHMGPCPIHRYSFAPVYQAARR
jgi:ribonuclease HII